MLEHQFKILQIDENDVFYFGREKKLMKIISLFNMELVVVHEYLFFFFFFFLIDSIVWLKIGYFQGTKPTVTLQKDGCFYYGTIQHELLHVLGLINWIWIFQINLIFLRISSWTRSTWSRWLFRYSSRKC